MQPSGAAAVSRWLGERIGRSGPCAALALMATSVRQSATLGGVACAPLSAGCPCYADRAAQAVGAMVAVPVRVLRVGQVLLVVVLGVVEGVQRADLRGDLAQPGAGDR